MSSKEEYVDLVDDFGNITKKKVLRSDIHKYPNLHLQIAIGVIFDEKGRILTEMRALTKSSEPGKIDHVCGAIESGETPETAVIRECIEETGIRPTNLKVIAQGFNSYGRYKYLLIGKVKKNSKPVRSEESEWVKFLSNKYLKQKKTSGELLFVDDFFENNEEAIKKAL